MLKQNEIFIKHVSRIPGGQRLPRGLLILLCRFSLPQGTLMVGFLGTFYFHR